MGEPVLEIIGPDRVPTAFGFASSRMVCVDLSHEFIGRKSAQFALVTFASFHSANLCVVKSVIEPLAHGRDQRFSLSAFLVE